MTRLVPSRTCGVLMALMCLMLGASSANEALSPAEVLKHYLTAVYARDYVTAYQWIARQDRRLKSQEEYVREHGAFTGATLEVSRALAALIRFQRLQTAIRGHRATVTVTAQLPNANDPRIQSLALAFDDQRLAALSVAKREAIIRRLHELAQTGQLPMLTTVGETWELVRGKQGWRVLLNWDKAVRVHFEAFVHPELPWRFTPVQPLVRALPGETLRTFYRVKNLGDHTLTGKARHLLKPAGDPEYVEIVSCFCFLQQTLEPGEKELLPVLFWVDPDIPDSVRDITVRYEFYPLERFPQGGQE